ncbi:hypothetical protein EOPP23_03830 [Endozoicomonas sp. OPT23]|uniref:hypothetical protein n=1 Tax=Endozoicomonas sp. OPT23 TaxID=2072845 RepID=UPI00129BA9F8|nr:hypothetical protein [Endozoicomonas sp. OPT23]MRI32124.1 hypothetical protein [Endozoicomonas sp. OPT23]
MNTWLIMAIPTGPDNNSIAQQLKTAAISLGKAALLSISKPTAFLRKVAIAIIPVKVWRALSSPITFSKQIYQRRVAARQENERSLVIQQFGENSRDYYLYCKESSHPFSEMKAIKTRFKEEVRNIYMDMESLRFQDPDEAGELNDRRFAFHNSLILGFDDLTSVQDVYSRLQQVSTDPAFPYLTIKFNELCNDFDMKPQLVGQCGSDAEVKTTDGFNKLYCAGYEWLRLNLGKAVTGKNKPGHLKDYTAYEQKALKAWLEAKTEDDLIDVASAYLPEFGSRELLEGWYRLAETRGVSSERVRSSVTEGQLALLDVKSELFDLLDINSLKKEFPLTHESVLAGIKQSVFSAIGLPELHRAVSDLPSTIRKKVVFALRDHEFGIRLSDRVSSGNVSKEKVAVKMKLYLSLREQLKSASEDGREHSPWELKLLSALSEGLDTDDFVSILLYEVDLAQLSLLSERLASYIKESTPIPEFENMETGDIVGHQFFSKCAQIDPVRRDYLGDLRQLMLSLGDDVSGSDVDDLSDIKRLFSAVISADACQKVPELVTQIAPKKYQASLLAAYEETMVAHEEIDSDDEMLSLNSTDQPRSLRSIDDSGE